MNLDPLTWLAVAAVALIIGLAIWMAWPRRVRRPPADVPQGPSGVGAALALALEGRLDRARALLTRHVQSGGADRPDAVLGLIAVLRAQGDFKRAAAIVRGLNARAPAPWLNTLCVRLCLDAGLVERAADFVRRDTPADLAVAAFTRAGRWSAAMACLARPYTDAAAEAGVLAGWAVSLYREGDERRARKQLKRALTLAPESLAVLAVQAEFAARAGDRERALAALSARIAPAHQPELLDTESTSLLAEADRLIEGSHVEAALGLLRNALDQRPDWPAVRTAYEQQLLLHGTPEDWRAALADRSDAAPSPADPAPQSGCGACGLPLTAPVFICPRCDRFDTLVIHLERPIPGVQPAHTGARLEDLGGP